MPMVKLPLLKITQTIWFLIGLTIVLYFGRQILIPVLFACMLAMLMTPICNKLDRKGFHRIFSSLICVFILLLVFLLMSAITLIQLSDFIRDLPLLQEKTDELLQSVQKFIETKFHIPLDQQTSLVKSEAKGLNQMIGNYMRGIIGSSLLLLGGMAITLAFTFLMLLHKEKYYAFFLKFSVGNSRQEKEEVLSSIAQVSQRYLTGRAISISILFILYIIALLVIGIEGALLLAAVSAIVNIIPYVGPILAAVFPVIVALVTQDGLQPAIWVAISFALIQAVDNYFVTPYFLGGEVSLSALSTIFIILCGGFTWGIAGMILFIPMLSIAKIIFDHVPGLKHYGEVIGDQEKTRPSAGIVKWFGRMMGKK